MRLPFTTERHAVATIEGWVSIAGVRPPRSGFEARDEPSRTLETGGRAAVSSVLEWHQQGAPGHMSQHGRGVDARETAPGRRQARWPERIARRPACLPHAGSPPGIFRSFFCPSCAEIDPRLSAMNAAGFGNIFKLFSVNSPCST